MYSVPGCCCDEAVCTIQCGTEQNCSPWNNISSVLKGQGLNGSPTGLAKDTHGEGEKDARSTRKQIRVWYWRTPIVVDDAGNEK
jgi:hypothetical protein